MALDFRKNNKATARGIRNNNPGNLRKTAISWQGEVKPGDDPAFEQFENMAWGYRALMLDMYADFKKGNNTIRKYISEYAPASENFTPAYITKVAKALNVSPDTPLLYTENVVKKIARVITEIENGKAQADLIPASEINEAWSMVKKKLGIKAATIGGTGLLLILLGIYLMIK